MPLQWNDLFFEDQAEILISQYGLTEEEAGKAREEWAEEMFELDKIVYRDGEKHILEGRNSALSTLQHICKKYVMARTGVRDRSQQLAPMRTE